MPARLTVLGSINMDLVVYADRLPASGETLLATDFQTFPGGKGANQAVAAARMGAQVQMLGKVGEDAFGEQLLANLRANGVDAEGVGRSKAPSGTALITVDRRGRNTIMVVPGANGEVLPGDLDGWQGALTRTDVLLMQLEIPLETVLAAARRARSGGARVMLNPSPAQPLPDELLSLVDVLVLNETEIGLISGEDVSTSEKLERAGRKLLELGVGWVVVTLGGEGVLAVDREEMLRAPAFEVEVVDTVAAGDAFTGALAVALAENDEFKVRPDVKGSTKVGRTLAEPVEANARRSANGEDELAVGSSDSNRRAALRHRQRARLDALRIANAAGALAVTVRGAQPSLPTRAQVVDFLRSR